MSVHSYESIERIVITGPESSGKTSLVGALCRHYHALTVPEFARSYLEQHGPDYGLEDLKEIAIGQFNLEDAIASTTMGLLLCDTGPLVLKIWAEYRFGQCPEFIEQAFRERSYTLYLLCKPDIPWEPDDLRENPNDRYELFGLYLHTLSQYRKPFTIISGQDSEERLRRAVQGIDRVIGRGI